MKLITFFLAALITVSAQAAPNATRETLSFNNDWRFHLGDEGYENSAPALTNWTWKSATPKEITNPGTAVAQLNAADWKTTAISEDIFNKKPGFAWLHASFPQRAGRTILQFGGMDDNATVFVNGRQVARHEGWNSAFKADATQALNANGANEVYVLVENTEGGGGLGGAVTITDEQKKTSGPALAAFNDANWRLLNVPHDWMIEGVKGADENAMDGPFDRKSPATHEGGYLNGGIGWYRKTFTPPAAMQGQRAYLQFNGVYMDSDVWLNGQYLGGQPYGYSTFGFDLTPHLKFGQANVIAVRCNVTQPASRFYSGAGIYRNVSLTYTNAVHIAPHGIYVTTPQIGPAQAQTRVRTTVQNEGETAANITLISTIITPDGKLRPLKKPRALWLPPALPNGSKI